MKCKFTLAAGTLAATLVALPVMAAGQHGGGAPMQGHQSGMMQNQQDTMMQGLGQQGVMPGGHSGMMGDHANMMQMMMKMHGQMMGGMHGKGMMGSNWLAVLDMDENSRLTQAEITEGLSARMQAHDANGDGTLSIDEFEALHSSMIRETMVDRFQVLDANGDGAVTVGEIEKGAKSLAPKYGMMGPKPAAKATDSDTGTDN